AAVISRATGEVVSNYRRPVTGDKRRRERQQAALPTTDRRPPPDSSLCPLKYPVLPVALLSLRRPTSVPAVARGIQEQLQRRRRSRPTCRYRNASPGRWVRSTRSAACWGRVVSPRCMKSGTRTSSGDLRSRYSSPTSHGPPGCWTVSSTRREQLLGSITRTFWRFTSWEMARG